MKTRGWLVMWVILIAFLLPGSVQADSACPGNGGSECDYQRTYSQHSYRFYWFHRAWNHCHPTGVESYLSTPSTDIQPQFYWDSYPCPFVYPVNAYPPGVRR